MQETIRQWDPELTALREWISSRFRRLEPQQRALGYLHGLLVR
jgi:hypothetical protein